MEKDKAKVLVYNAVIDIMGRSAQEIIGPNTRLEKDLGMDYFALNMLAEFIGVSYKKIKKTITVGGLIEYVRLHKK